MNIVFIVGTGRCGSTLINDIVAAHPMVGYVSEAEDQWIPGSARERVYRLLDAMNLLQLTGLERGKRKPSEGYRVIAREVSPIFVKPCRDLFASDVTPWTKERFRNFFEQRMKKTGQTVFVHKYTGWSRIGFLAEIFPEARFINIVRDGRAVANSWLQMQWWGGYEGPSNWLWGPLCSELEKEWEQNNYSFAVLAGLSWKKLMKSYELASENISNERYQTIRYEDFINDPRGIMTNVLSFIGLEWEKSFVDHFSNLKIRKTRSQAFREDLSPLQLGQLNQSLGHMLSKYGYEI